LKVSSKNGQKTWIRFGFQKPKKSTLNQEENKITYLANKNDNAMERLIQIRYDLLKYKF